MRELRCDCNKLLGKYHKDFKGTVRLFCSRCKKEKEFIGDYKEIVKRTIVYFEQRISTFESVEKYSERVVTNSIEQHFKPIFNCDFEIVKIETIALNKSDECGSYYDIVAEIKEIE